MRRVKSILRAIVGGALILALLMGWLHRSRAQTPIDPSLRLPPPLLPTDGPARFVPGELLLRLAENPARSRDAAHLLGVEATALTPLELPGQPALFRLAVAAGDEEKEATRLSAQPGVLYAEPNFLFYLTETVPNDSLYNRYQWNLRHIQAQRAWDRTTGSPSVILAIADTGVDTGHPDLAAKIVGGIDVINNDFDAQDDQGHGTHVASIAAAVTNNAAGIAGLDWNARLMPVKVLNSAGVGDSLSLATGVTWAADNGARVLNMSLAGSAFSITARNAMNYAHSKGVVLVAAAGNAYTQGNPVSYPAAYEHVIGVAAVNDSDGHASYSNSGSYVDVAAPGGDPSSSSDPESRHWIPGAYWRGGGFSYGWLAGTSQAAPHVAGLAGLLLAINPTLSPDQLTQLITGTAVDVQAPGWDVFSGYGRIDVAAALAAVPSLPTATPTPTPSPTPAPTATPTPTPPPRSRADVRLNSTAVNSQSAPALVIDGPGNLTALWRDRRSGMDALYSAGLAADAIHWGPNLLLEGSALVTPTDAIGTSGLAGGQTGALAAIWQVEGSDGRPIFVSRFDAGGWGAAEQVTGSSLPAGAGNGPGLGLLANGTLVAVWADGAAGALNDASGRLYWSQSAGGRGAWSAPEAVAPTGAGQTAPRLAVAGNTLYAVWVERDADGDRVVYSRWQADGPVWSAPGLVAAGLGGVSLHTPDVAADDMGNLLVVWQMEGAAGQIYAAWHLAGDGWRGPVVVGRGIAPRLSTNGREAALVWQEEGDDGGDIALAWAVWPGGEWLPARRVNQDEGGVAQRGPGVAMDARGNTTVVWEDDRFGSAAPDIFSRFIPALERYWFFLPQVRKP